MGERRAAKPQSRQKKRGEGDHRKGERSEELWDSPNGEQLATEETTHLAQLCRGAIGERKRPSDLPTFL